MARKKYKVAETPAMRYLNKRPKTEEDAKTIAKFLDAVKKKYGTLRPEDIVREAQRKDSGVYDYFEWDRSKAHYKYLIDQARALVQTVQVVQTNGKTITGRAYVSSSEPTTGEQEYKSREEILSSDELTELRTQRGLKELRNWCERYGDMPKLKLFIREALKFCAQNITDDRG